MKWGLVVTLVVMVALEFFARGGRAVAFPGPILQVAVIHATLVDGWLWGLGSAVLTIVYAVWAFAVPGQPFHYSADGVQRLVLHALLAPAIVAVVGYVARLKRRDDGVDRDA